MMIARCCALHRTSIGFLFCCQRYNGGLCPWQFSSDTSQSTSHCNRWFPAAQLVMFLYDFFSDPLQRTRGADVDFLWRKKYGTDAVHVIVWSGWKHLSLWGSFDRLDGYHYDADDFPPPCTGTWEFRFIRRVSPHLPSHRLAARVSLKGHWSAETRAHTHNAPGYDQLGWSNQWSLRLLTWHSSLLVAISACP